MASGWPRRLRLGTRGSALAQAQARAVAERLRAAAEVEVELVVVHTSGDRDQRRPLAEMGGRGVFVKEIEEALLARQVDVAVHSAKDVPARMPEGLAIAAVPERADPRDCLVTADGRGWAHLPKGAVLGTSSVRRRAQLLRARPDLRFVPLRGNVDTRLRKILEEGLDGIVLAAAGLDRLGLGARISERLSPDLCLPDPGQGALLVQARSDQPELLALLARIDQPAARWELLAERAVLAGLGGGCQVPVAALARVAGDQLTIDAAVAAPDGSQLVRRRLTGPVADALILGARLAGELLAAGAARLLAPLALGLEVQAEPTAGGQSVRG